MTRTFLDLRDAVAGYFEKNSDDAALSRGNVDLLTVAINQALRSAQSKYDFHLNLEEVTVVVDPAVGVQWNQLRSDGDGVYDASSKDAEMRSSVTGLGLWAPKDNARAFDEDVSTVSKIRLDATVGPYTSGTIYNVTQAGSNWFVAPGFNAADYRVFTDWSYLLGEVINVKRLNGLWITQVDGSKRPLRIYRKRDAYIDGLEAEVRMQPQFAYDRIGNIPTNEAYANSMSAYLRGNWIKFNTVQSASVESLNMVFDVVRYLPDLLDDTDTNFLLDFGWDYVFWKSVVQLNYLFERYLVRAEASLGPPERLLAAAWDELIEWDSSVAQQGQYNEIESYYP